MKDLSKKNIVIICLLLFLSFNAVRTMFSSSEVESRYSEREVQIKIAYDRLQQQNQMLIKKDKQLQQNIHKYEKIISENTVRIVNSSMSYRDSLRSAINPR